LCGFFLLSIIKLDEPYTSFQTIDYQLIMSMI